MKVKLLLVAVIVTMVMGATPTAQREAGSAPTYNQDVASIIFDECVVCHRPGQIAPMSFMSYQEVRPWARAIKFRVAKREMPPWHADPRFGAFANERRLTDEQIQTIAAWADAGAPQGSGPLAAKPPLFKKGFLTRMYARFGAMAGPPCSDRGCGCNSLLSGSHRLYEWFLTQMCARFSPSRSAAPWEEGADALVPANQRCSRLSLSRRPPARAPLLVEGLLGGSRSHRKVLRR